MKSLLTTIGWLLLAVIGAGCLAVLALNRGEQVGALWLLTAAMAIYLVGYRFYARFVASRILQLDSSRLTPAYRFNDGKDYVPTHKWVLFGHHFAAIAGAGPLIGPVLAAQMGYLPGTLWLIIGVVLAGAIQDMIVLWTSTRRHGASLGEMIKNELGPFAGTVATLGILSIMIILLAVLALVVVKALAHSPWGLVTIAATLPIAVLMGCYLRYWRPGKVGEVSILGFALLLLSIWLGQWVSQHPVFGPWFTCSGETLAWLMIGYGFIASVLPVWLLLAPRDYLSTFLKIGTILMLAIGILLVAPDLQMPAISRFVDGSGPVFAGSLFPFLFITIACGAVSGFHSLIASGTTPKLIENENQIPLIGYGSMLVESMVAIMALIAASVLEPGIYFALNSPAAVLGTSVESAAKVISEWGFLITPEALSHTASAIGETSILSRTGGAPTLAVGMAKILSDLFGSEAMMAFWYHFAILFEALFILTTLDAGTRVGRFMIQDALGNLHPVLGKTDNLAANLLATSLCVGGWGYFLYQGVVDPLGGINSLWPLFGIANQMLAGIALMFVTVVLVRRGQARFAWVTAVPAAWVLLTTLWAAFDKLWHANPKIGFLAQVKRYQAAVAEGKLLPPAQSLAQMEQVIRNNQINAWVCGFFVLMVLTLLLCSVRVLWRIRSGKMSGHTEAQRELRSSYGLV